MKPRRMKVFGQAMKSPVPPAEALLMTPPMEEPVKKGIEHTAKAEAENSLRMSWRRSVREEAASDEGVRAGHEASACRAGRTLLMTPPTEKLVPRHKMFYRSTNRPISPRDPQMSPEII